MLHAPLYFVRRESARRPSCFFDLKLNASEFRLLENPPVPCGFAFEVASRSDLLPSAREPPTLLRLLRASVLL